MENKKEQYRYVVNNWNTKTSQEIRDHLNLKNWQLSGIATKLRKLGINLPRKTICGIFTPDFIEELKQLYR